MSAAYSFTFDGHSAHLTQEGASVKPPSGAKRVIRLASRESRSHSRRARINFEASLALAFVFSFAAALTLSPDGAATNLAESRPRAAPP